MKDSKEYKEFRTYVNKQMFTATAYPGTAMWNSVKNKLSYHFGISYNKFGQPICDEAFHNYVLELDDATKVLNDRDGNPVNFGELSIDKFLQAREHINNGNIEKILEME
jgi:hypothetical protein